MKIEIHFKKITWKTIVKAVLGLFIGFFFVYGLRLFMIFVAFNSVMGKYDSSTGFFMCRSEKACTHEVGHWWDDYLEMPSSSEEFKDFIDEQINFCRTLKSSFMCQFEDFPGIVGNPLRESGWGGYREVYADIYEEMRLNGEPPNMPELLRFYSQGWNISPKE